jgi:hypothetical protein
MEGRTPIWRHCSPKARLVYVLDLARLVGLPKVQDVHCCEHVQRMVAGMDSPHMVSVHLERRVRLLGLLVHVALRF